MKKVAILLPSLGGGGAERISLNLARELVAMGNEVHIVLLANQVSYDVDDDLEIHSLSATGKITGQRALDRILLARRLKKLLSKLSGDRSFDLILSNLLDVDHLISKLSFPNVYFVIHNTTSREITTLSAPAKVKRRTRKILSTYAGKNLVCVSDGVKEDLVGEVGVKPATITTIYNPFNILDIQQKAGQSLPGIPKDDYLIHVGRIHPQKRVDVLLAAFRQVKTSCKLVMLAQPTAELHQMIADEGVTDRVVLPGFQTNPYPWIRNARLFVLSSDYEGLPTVIIESLICGTPVVSTDCPSGPSEILNGDLQQWLVPTNNPAALAGKIDAALAHEFDLGDFDVKRFCIRNVASQYLALCKHA